jgi:methyltransferase (TIGR00027 family)
VTLPGVGATALSVAQVRAHESERPDGLFHDPYAGAFTDAMPMTAFHAATGSPQARTLRALLSFHVRIRTRFFDDYLRSAVDEGCAQVVLVGAGLDTEVAAGYGRPPPSGGGNGAFAEATRT